MSVGFRHSNANASKKDLGNIIEKLQTRFESRIDKLEKRLVTVQSHTEALLSECFKLNLNNHGDFSGQFQKKFEANGTSSLHAPDSGVSKKQMTDESCCQRSTGNETGRTGVHSFTLPSSNTDPSPGIAVSSDIVFAHLPSVSFSESSCKEYGVSATDEVDGIPEETARDQTKPPPRGQNLRIASGRELLRGGGYSDGSSSSSEDEDEEAEQAGAAAKVQLLKEPTAPVAEPSCVSAIHVNHAEHGRSSR